MSGKKVATSKSIGLSISSKPKAKPEVVPKKASRAIVEEDDDEEIITASKSKKRGGSSMLVLSEDEEDSDQEGDALEAEEMQVEEPVEEPIKEDLPSAKVEEAPKAAPSETKHVQSSGDGLSLSSGKKATNLGPASKKRKVYKTIINDKGEMG